MSDIADLVISAPQGVIDQIDRAARQQGNSREDYIYIVLINALWNDLGPAEAFAAEADLKKYRDLLRALELYSR